MQVVCSHLPHRDWNLEPNSLINKVPLDKNACLSINQSNILRLQKYDFAFTSNVKRLIFEDNQVSRIDPETFHGDFAKNLEKISLKNNPIANLNYEFYANLPNLKELDLSFTKLNNFESIGLNGSGIPT